MEKSLSMRQLSSLSVTETSNKSSAAVSPVMESSNSNSNFINEWILSDFNLVSHDFNRELSFISGNLFDLNFNYKFVGLVNESCFLMKLRHPVNDSSDSLNEDQFYLLKVR